MPTQSCHAAYRWRPLNNAGRWTALPPLQRLGAPAMLAPIAAWSVTSCEIHQRWPSRPVEEDAETDTRYLRDDSSRPVDFH